MNNINISKAIPEDSYGITSVRRQTWRVTYPNEKEGITKEEIEQALNKSTIEEESIKRAEIIKNNKDIHIWVAKNGDVIVGYAESQKNEDKNRIGAIYILPEYQKQGIGSKLMTNVLSWLG